MSPVAWPEARLSPIARARAVAEGIPGAAWEVTTFDAPYRSTWDWVADLEHSVPQFDDSVSSIRVRERHDRGDHEELAITARNGPLPLRFDVRLEDGYCLMRGRGRLYVVLMAAEPVDDGARTRFFHCEAIPLPGIGTLARPPVRRMVAADVANLRRLVPR